jgi:hypothetical protein
MLQSVPPYVDTRRALYLTVLPHTGQLGRGEVWAYATAESLGEQAPSGGAGLSTRGLGPPCRGARRHFFSPRCPDPPRRCRQEV